MECQYDEDVNRFLGEEGQFVADELGGVVSSGFTSRVQRSHALRVQANTDESMIGSRGNLDIPEVSPEEKTAFHKRQQELMEHFTVAKAKGLVNLLGLK